MRLCIDSSLHGGLHLDSSWLLILDTYNSSYMYEPEYYPSTTEYRELCSADCGVGCTYYTYALLLPCCFWLITLYMPILNPVLAQSSPALPTRKGVRTEGHPDCSSCRGSHARDTIP